MRIKCFSIAFAVSALATGPSLAGPLRAGEFEASAVDTGIVLVQSVKERPLDSVPPIDSSREPTPYDRSAPPPPPPVPPAPRYSTRTVPPPAADDDTAPPAREVPPPPLSTTRVAPPPPRLTEPAPTYRAAPRYDDPPARRADTPPHRTPPTPSTFSTNCTQQCHLSCEASFEACNGDSSPAKPACVKRLESCRVERCSCRLD